MLFSSELKRRAKAKQKAEEKAAKEKAKAEAAPAVAAEAKPKKQSDEEIDPNVSYRKSYNVLKPKSVLPSILQGACCLSSGVSTLSC